MRALIVTTEISYLPDNYNSVIIGLVETPEIHGLVLLRNSPWYHLRQGLAALIWRSAPALGWQIVKNFFSALLRKRERAYRQLNKRVWIINDLNDPRFHKLLERQKINVVINLRNPMILGAQSPFQKKFGFLNLHDGLLPEQKGFMCDFWSHIEERKTGFTLHEMGLKHEYGPIVRRVEVPRSSESYLEYLERANLLELAMLRNFISEVRTSGTWKAVSQRFPVQAQFHKSPNPSDFEAFKKTGLGI